MKHKFPSMIVVLSILLALAFSAMGVAPARAAGICYVNVDASGANSGTSWVNAYTSLQSALAGTCTEIWVAAGAYKPTTESNRNATFQLKSGVAVYGGFAGTETLLTQRNPATNVTILSGDLLGDDSGFTNNTENSYHVVTGANGATLDGFTVTAGNANGANCPGTGCGGGMYNGNSSPTVMSVTFSGNSTAYYGGGMYNVSSSSPALTNVTFSGNNAGYLGGGMLNDHSSPTLANATFSGNSAEYDGGGMCNYDNSSPTLTNVTFSGNSATSSGGGMCNKYSSPVLTNVTFSDNTAAQSGGMDNYYSNPTLTNVTFSGNSAEYGGGGMSNDNSSPVLTNVTFSDNSAQNGGGMYNSAGSPMVTNVILWGDTGGEIYNNSATPTVTYSVVEGGYAGTGNLDIDPKLGPLGNYGGSTQTLPLVSGSSAIDAGNDSACPATDQHGVARPQGAHCDIGAFESVPGEYILFITSAHGTVTKSPNQAVYHENDTVQLTAIPDVDWGFSNWSGDLAGSDNPASFVVHSDMFITAHYACPTPVITVTSDSDSGPGSLRQAIADICPGGTITFDADRTITLASELLIDHDMTIDGQTHAVTVSGNHVTRVFNISSGNVAFDHLTIADGNVQTTDCGPWSGGANYYCGGGMILQGNLVTVTVSHSIFSNNQADTYGGGIANFGDALTITDSTFSGNNADYDGGGMFNYRSSLALTNVTFSGNSAASFGGGMFNSSSNPVITNVTFSGNSAQHGGGMSNSAGNPALTNVTFSGNSAAGWGGGMHNANGNPTLTNTTFSGNSAGTYGGGIFNNSGSPVLTNVILWGDTGEEEIYNNSGDTPTVTYSVVEGGYVGTGNLDIDPKLGPLGDYGGSTQFMPLLSSSPAIDVGNDSACPAADQRGVARPQGAHCDIGAFESVPGEYILFITSAHGTVTRSPNQAVYRENDAVQLTAIPDVRWGFSNWSGDLAGSDNPASFIVHNDMFITANFTCTLMAITVTSNNDSGPGSLRQAIADICPGGTITFDANRTITLASELLIDHDMTIDGQTHAVTVSGNHVTRVFNISSGNVAFDHLIIADGNVQTTDCNLWAGGNYCGGGMILQNNLVTVTVSHSIFSNNQAGHYGGGIANFGGALTITDSTFNGNSADSGGGMSNIFGSPTLTNVTFSGNSAASSGGGMFNSSSNPMLTNVTFSDNSAQHGGGMFNSSSNPTITNATFSSNSATDGDGGGMYNSDSNPTVTNSTFSGNSAGSGGGMSNGFSSPKLTNVTFSGNSASWGGGMFNSYSSPTVTNVTFSSNPAQQGGGMNNHHSSPTVTNVTFSSNPAQQGGGMYNDHSNLALTNSTFSGNSASWGGGIYNYQSSPTVTNVTFSGNSAVSHGGGMVNDSSSPVLTNVILWGDTGGEIYNNSSATPRVTYSVVEGGYAGVGNLYTDPKLGSLSNNYGFTQTIPLLSGSPAIDAGKDSACPAADQRGVARPQGAHCDIGAFENQVEIFSDIASNHWAKSFIKRLYLNGVTGGCGTNPLRYCPNNNVTRAQMAVFLLVSEHGTGYAPPNATGTVFGDVPVDNPYAKWIEQLAAEGITGGCGGGNYCPNTYITRAQMAVFLLVAEHGTGYTPPAATGIFNDVPADNPYAKWIEQLYKEGITGGCGGGNFCPNKYITRAEMAVFLVAAFNLP